MSEHQVQHSVVVGADGTQEGYVAVRFAASEAQRLGTPLDVVSVAPGYLPTGPLPMIPDGALQSYGQQTVERAVAIARETAPGLEVRSHLLSGGRVRELVGFTEGARLLVIGSRHRSAARRVWTGATVTGVSARVRCPLLVVPPDWQVGSPPVGRIVAGLKSPKDAADLFDTAFALADELGAELVVLHAWKLQGGYDDIVAEHVEAEKMNAEGTTTLQPLLDYYRHAYPDVTTRLDVVHEQPAHALVEASTAADRVLIVRPTHSHLHHLGSTARGLLRAAHCPVEVLAASGTGGGTHAGASSAAEEHPVDEVLGDGEARGRRG